MYKETATTTAESSVHESLKKTQHKKLEKTHLHNLKLSLSVKRYQGPLGSVFLYEKTAKFGIEFVKVAIKVEIRSNR